VTTIVNPLAGGPVVLATAVGAAEGSRGAAAALACAGGDADRAVLLVDVGGNPPRPTLLASAASQRLEERLAAHLPNLRAAARGQICQLRVPADEEGLAAAAAAVTVARDALSVLHLPQKMLRPLLEAPTGPRPTGVLLRADVVRDRPLVALLVRDLFERELRVGVLKRRLGWVAERRALFGALPAETAGGLPPRLLNCLASHACYASRHDPEADSARTAKPERRDHAGTGPR
jgi:hypothetical protein